jgi:L-fuconate dehydratase
MRPQSIAEFTYPGGTFWAADLAHQKSGSRPSDKQKGEAA